MSQVWVLQQVDYEDVQVLGVFTTHMLASVARGRLWEQYWALPAEARALVGPHQLRHQARLTCDVFLEAHPIEAWELNSVKMPYAPLETRRS